MVLIPDSPMYHSHHSHQIFDFLTTRFMANAAMANFHAIWNVYGSEPLLDEEDVIDPRIRARPPMERTCGFHFE
jgi:hypothetical protein